MSSQARDFRPPPLRWGHRKRKALMDLDLNVPPPNESSSSQGESLSEGANRGVDASEQGQVVAPTTIDVEALDDDDVVEASATAFAQAKNNAERNRRRAPAVIDVESGQTSGGTPNNGNRRRRVVPNQMIINCETYIDLESGGSSATCQPPPTAPTPPPPRPSSPPPPEPSFSCPICIGPFVQETSTRCGHIFCKECIKAAIAKQAKCPTCRKKVTVKELIRVFLPDAK